MSTQQIEERAEMSFALPPELFNKGWKLFSRKSTAPFIAENEAWELDTGGFPTIEGAVEKAGELTIEEEERQAIEPEDLDPLEPGIQMLTVADIRTDGGTQPRSELNMHVVADYAEAMREGAKFPPVDVFFDGKDVWLGDGFHRHAASKEAEIEEIFANVQFGTQRDALLYSLGANATHGLPRSREDKRRAVMVMLEDEEWSKFSDNVIAQKCGVSQPFVSKLHREGVTQNVLSEQPVREGVDGVARDTSNIGKEREEDDRQPSLTEASVSIPDTSATVDPDEEEDGESKNWKSQDIVDVLTRHGGVLMRLQLEEMGISYAAIHNALSEGSIAQPETGKFTLPDHKPQPSGDLKHESSASSSAPKPKPSVEEMLKGRKLSVSFTWLPGVTGKVSVSVNMGMKPTEAERGVIASDEAPKFPEKVIKMIAEQIEKYAVHVGRGGARVAEGRVRVKKKTPAKAASKKSTKKASKKKAPTRRKK